MGYFLIWIELLLVGTLTAAMCIAVVSRLSVGWASKLVGCVLVALPLSAAIWLFAERHQISQFYNYFLALAVCVTCAAAAVVLVGSKRDPISLERRARSWRPDRLAIAWALVICLHILTVSNMDSAVRGALAATTSEAGSVALNVAPLRVADEENAATVYYKAFQTLDQPQVLDQIAEQSGEYETNFKARIGEVRRALDKQRLNIGLIRRAASLPACRFDRDYARPSISMLLPEIQGLRTAARLLSAEARVKVYEHRVGEAFEDISAMFRIARHAGMDALLVTHLVSVAIHQDACRTLEAALSASQPTAEDLEKLDINELLSFQMLLSRSLLMEEAFGLSIFSVLHEAVPEYRLGGLLSSPLAPYVRIFFLSSELQEYRLGMMHVREIAQRPYYRGGKELEHLPPRPGMLPSFETVSRATTRADADHTLAVAACAVAKYRTAKGELPKDLSELSAEFVTATLIDPYDGKPIKFVTSENEIILYCVGPDGVDQQGAKFDEDGRTGDISFRIRSDVAK
jgi:hypothetical protein